MPSSGMAAALPARGAFARDGAMADIATVEGAWPTDPRAGRVGGVARRRHVVAEGGDAQDPSAVGDHFAVVDARAGVEHAGRVAERLLESLDDMSLAV